jgi:hypothetical protein
MCEWGEGMLKRGSNLWADEQTKGWEKRKKPKKANNGDNNDNKQTKGVVG